MSTSLFLAGLFVLGIGGYLLGSIERREGVLHVTLNWWGWLVFMGAVAVVALALVESARAADEITCALYGNDVEQLVKLATNDEDVAQAARFAGERWCGVIDEPPLIFPKNIVEKPKNIAALTPSAPVSSAKDKWCRKRFGSYREADGSVLKKVGGKRVPCPFPG